MVCPLGNRSVLIVIAVMNMTLIERGGIASTIPPGK
ncbi:hypothetical protein YPC_3990 [Yersinia pestis biovar Medievalis str. Harbin 35]|nr:hypothetical protein YPC_3990 [Yersinia pestis biovar Medievalis str. Harbin 35]EEO78247.1 hypothetical protein YP516_0475 [Yersinia pestis Nepal516]EEO82100.1 hypothetical protein YPF_1324 [Yersinia pestis biovar Orientalis str. India 195]EEO86893.1 hypothetical protein YPH_2822 [Yersinia pestis biovar Orientalis str. PEXU2]EEO91399.1 hypothetical protein YPS_1180 [Yersinia pestis Pestoides A]